MRMPNGALASLAGNVDRTTRRRRRSRPRPATRPAAVERLMRDRIPDVVGLSVMTFQRRTALRLVRLIRAHQAAT